MPRLLERERDAADLADRVDGADLVEVDALGVDAVDAPLGVREPPERLLRARARALRQAGGVDLRADRRPVAVRLARRAADASRASPRSRAAAPARSTSSSPSTPSPASPRRTASASAPASSSAPSSMSPATPPTQSR